MAKLDMRVHGPNRGKRATPNSVRFLRKVQQVSSGCHEWQAACRSDGYGAFTFEGRSQQAHRVAWKLFKGEIPAELWVLHKCDNRKCVNLDHLYLGTPKENSRDRSERSNSKGNTRHSLETIMKAKQLYATGQFSQQKIGDMLGVSQAQISKYILGRQRKTA